MNEEAMERGEEESAVEDEGGEKDEMVEGRRGRGREGLL